MYFRIKRICVVFTGVFRILRIISYAKYKNRVIKHPRVPKFDEEIFGADLIKTHFLRLLRLLLRACLRGKYAIRIRIQCSLLLLSLVVVLVVKLAK